MILAALPEKQHESVAAEFRGQDAHNLDSLRHRYSQTNSPPLPRVIHNSLLFVSTWNTALRYKPGRGNSEDAIRFFPRGQGNNGLGGQPNLEGELWDGHDSEAAGRCSRERR